MIIYFNNPNDKVSVNTLQYLFVNDVYPVVIQRGSDSDDKGLWISFLPTVILCSDSYQEYARIEDYTIITPQNVQWLIDNAAAIMAGTSPTDIPQGIKLKGV